VLCGYCHLVFHPTCLDPLTGVENWDELAELNAIEYAVKYATKTKPGDYVIDCAPPVAGCAAAAAAVAASEGGRCFTKYKECPLSAYAAAAAAVTAPLGTPGNERGSATAACTCGGTRPQRRRSRRPAAASSKAPQGGRGGRKREREGGGGGGGGGGAPRRPAASRPDPPTPTRRGRDARRGTRDATEPARLICRAADARIAAASVRRERLAAVGSPATGTAARGHYTRAPRSTQNLIQCHGENGEHTTHAAPPAPPL